MPASSSPRDCIFGLLFLFCNFTVGRRVVGGLDCWAGTSDNVTDDSEGTARGVVGVFGWSGSGGSEETLLLGSCLLRKASGGAIKWRGEGRFSGGSTYGREVDAGSSMDVSSLTALPELGWSKSSSL